MESFEHNVAYITTPISTYMLIFGTGGGGALIILFFLHMLTNPIIPQI